MTPCNPSDSLKRHRISGDTSIFGIFGDPVAHSLSPAIWNAAFLECGLPAVYIPFRVSPANLSRALGGLASLGIQGGNVTFPHKQTAAALCSELHGPAQILKTVNTIWMSADEGLHGANTDAEVLPGLLDSLPEFRSVLVMGAGGAAKSVLWSLCQRSLDVVYLTNRSAISLDVPAGEGRTALEKVPWTDAAIGVAMNSIDLIINATPLGWNPQDSLPPGFSRLRRGQTFFDLNYSTDSPLQDAARTAGLHVVDGRQMLLQQAFLAFARLTGHPAPQRIMEQVLAEKLAGNPSLSIPGPSPADDFRPTENPDLE